MNIQSGWRYRGEEDKAPLHYTDCGLDDVFLLSGYRVTDTPYGSGVSIKDVDQLHEAIGCSLAGKKKVLSGKELRFLRKHMDVTQSELGKLVGLSSQQVARWEKGESVISGPADLLVRALFIQHVGGHLNLRDLANSLEELDAPLNDRICFENTAAGWEVRAAAHSALCDRVMA